MSLKQVMSALAVSSVLSLPSMASDYLDTSTSFSDENKNTKTRVIFVPEGTAVELPEWSGTDVNAVSRAAEIEKFKGEASQLTTVIAPEGTKSPASGRRR